MTKVIEATNVNDALAKGLQYLVAHGVESNSRVGRVLVSPTPVITEYARPNERVLFSPLRDANPFFHLMEALWMLAGRNDVAFVSYYAKQMADFSDDGKTLHGAYGRRWHYMPGESQIEVIIKELQSNPQSRRCVLQMWDCYDDDAGHADLRTAVTGGKDVPCNTQAYFDTLGGLLNMTVTCRSNDIIWGCYGANAVHFSVLHEYVALSAGLPQGVYRQFSNNYHMYIDRPDVKRLLDSEGNPKPYETVNYELTPYVPLWNYEGSKEMFDSDLNLFFEKWSPGNIEGRSNYRTPLFKYTVVPMVNAHHYFKDKNMVEALAEAAIVQSVDWRKACKDWLERRVK